MDSPVISKTITKSVEVKGGIDIMQPPEASEVVVIDEKTLPDTVRDSRQQAKQNMEDDYTYARKNLRELLEKGMGAVDGAIQLSKEAESPRVYEATAAFIKTLAEINKDLLNLADTVNKSQGPDNSGSSGTQSAGTINNNTIYLGSSEDLSDMVMVQRRLQHVNQ